MAKRRRSNTREDRTTNADGAQPKHVGRRVSDAMNELLDVRLPVLDDGFVRVVDYMGDDLSIVQAARVSYGEGTKRVQSDRGLIRYLMRHAHTTPFEMCELKLHIRAPMDVWRQWIRHRTASVNEYSTRYSIAIDAAQRTDNNGWRYQAATNRQGSEGRVPTALGSELSSEERKLHKIARETYEKRIAAGVAREQARKDLPLSTYTEAYWKMDLHNLLHFLELRMDAHAQSEIRAYAHVIGNDIVSKWAPITWEAFCDYRLESLRFSRIELQVIRALVGGQNDRARSAAHAAGLLPDTVGSKSKPNRERTELEAKLAALGFRAPW